MSGIYFLDPAPTRGRFDTLGGSMSEFRTGGLGPAVIGVTSVDIDGRFSVFNPRTQRVLTLNETASDVWRLCAGDLDQEAIVRSLAAAYAQPADVIRGSVIDTIELFRSEGLIESAADDEPASG